MGRHKVGRGSTVSANVPSEGQVLRQIVWVVALVNAGVGVALLAAAPGLAPSIDFLREVAPLPLWAVVFVAVAVLLVFHRNVAAHLVAVPSWMLFGIGAVLGLLNGSTRSPAASFAFTVLIVGMCAHHMIGLRFRRHLGLARRAEAKP